LEIPLRLLIITKDFGDPKSDISVDNIIDAGGLREFVEEYVRTRPSYPPTAFQLFSKKIKGLDFAVRLFRQIKKIECEVYFITPFAVLIEDEPVIPYKEGIDDIPLEKLRKLFELFGVSDRIYALLESQPEFLIFITNVKLIKMLDLFQNISKNTIAFILSKTPIESYKEHIKTVYPNPYYNRLLRHVEPKLSHDNFITVFLKSIAKIFLKLYEEMGDEKFYNFMKDAKENPSDFFNLILDENMFREIGESRDADLLKFFR